MIIWSDSVSDCLRSNGDILSWTFHNEKDHLHVRYTECIRHTFKLLFFQDYVLIKIVLDKDTNHIKKRVLFKDQIVFAIFLQKK